MQCTTILVLHIFDCRFTVLVLYTTEKTPVCILLTASEHITPDPDLEYVSEDEPPLLIRPPMFHHTQQQQKTNDIIDEESESESELQIEYTTSSDQRLLPSFNIDSTKHCTRSG